VNILLTLAVFLRQDESYGAHNQVASAMSSRNTDTATSQDRIFPTSSRTQPPAATSSHSHHTTQAVTTQGRTFTPSSHQVVAATSRNTNTATSQDRTFPASSRTQPLAATSSHSHHTAVTSQGRTFTTSSHDQVVATTSRNPDTSTSQDRTFPASSRTQSVAATSSQSHSHHTATANSQGRTFISSSHDQVGATTTTSRNPANPHTATSQGRTSTPSSHNQVVAATSRNQHTETSEDLALTASPHSFATTLATDSATSHHRHGTVERFAHSVHKDTNNDESDKESETGDDAVPPQARAKRNSKRTSNDPHPHHLGFYSGTWYDLLVEAKNHYRLFIHTQKPFPERNRIGLRDAQDCLLETISKYKDNGIQLDEGTINLLYAIDTNNIIDVYNTHRSSMTSLVSS
jgi:hypothetical protein